ncbi:hypothetical protein Tco_1273061 [Tanacetum coccineum]
MTSESIQAMIDQALLRNSTNGDGSHSSHGDNRRNVQTTRPCFYADFMKCQPLNFKGIKGVVGLTRWIEKMELVFNISGCVIENQVKFASYTLLVLKKKMTDKYCLQGEMKKLEIELWNLKRNVEYPSEGSAMPTDPQHTPTTIQPSTSQPQLKQRSRRPKRKDTEVSQPGGPTYNVADEGSGPRRQDTMRDTIARTRFENVSKTSNDSLLTRVNTPRSDEDRLKLNKLMEFCTKLQQRVLDLENTQTAQAQEIKSMKLRVKKLEKKRGSRTHKLKRLYKVGRSARVISSNEASLGDCRSL